MLINNLHIETAETIRDILKPSWNWISYRTHSMGFLIWYVFKNSVNIKTETEELILNVGDTYIFDLSKNHVCSQDPQNPASLFTILFYCDETSKLKSLLEKNIIIRKNHPAFFDTNIKLLTEASKLNNNREKSNIWLAPIFDQLLKYSSYKYNSKIDEIIEMIDNSPEKDYNLEELSKLSGYSKNQFVRNFKKATGVTPYAYIIDTRINQAKHLLLSNYTVTEIASILGYCDLNHFSSQFHLKTGFYPGEYKHILKK